jgi:hypothetical protein
MPWVLFLVFALVVPLILIPVTLAKHKNIDSIFITSKTSTESGEKKKDSATVDIE